MKKNEFKDSLNYITPDEHLRTRLKAKVEARPQKQVKAFNKLSYTTAAICCALIITALGAGISLVKEPEVTAELSYKYAENSTETSESETKGKDSILVSNPSWINNVTEEINTAGITLSVKGNNIAEKSFVKFNTEKNTAEISLTAVLEALGGKITQYNKSLAVVELNGITYHLNFEHKRISEMSSDKNLFADENGICLIKARTVNEQYVIDNISMENLMNNLGYSFSIDFESRTITIF